MKTNCINAIESGIEQFDVVWSLIFYERICKNFRLIFISHSSILGIATGGKTMQDMVRVVVDAMGGDNAPGEIVKGAVEALNAREDIFIYLTGRKPVIEAELSKYTFPKERLEIVHTEEVIETAEPPVMAIRRKKILRS